MERSICKVGKQEDERIVLWEFALGPGERTACHTHDKDYMFYVLEGSTPIPTSWLQTLAGAWDFELGAFLGIA